MIGSAIIPLPVGERSYRARLMLHNFMKSRWIMRLNAAPAQCTLQKSHPTAEECPSGFMRLLDGGTGSSSMTAFSSLLLKLRAREGPLQVKHRCGFRTMTRAPVAGGESLEVCLEVRISAKVDYKTGENALF